MKYIIIGFAIIYIAIPIFTTIAKLPKLYTFRDFLLEWWDTLKDIALIVLIILASLVAIVFIMFGIYSYTV